MKTNIIPAIKLTLVCLIFFSGIYTAIVLGFAQLAPNKGEGETITQDDKKYYTNIGQSFTLDQYFYSRPSAVNYNAAGAGASNKGVSNPDYLAQVQARIDTFLKHNPDIKKTEIPSELVTASGSGLDPNISVQGAKVQVKRISKIRHIEEIELLNLISQNTEAPIFGCIGTEKVNVLKLNLALDKLN